jgi:hypothetical protein
MTTTPPKPPITIGVAATRLSSDDAERRRKALETLRRSLLSAAKQVAVLEEIEERKETAA